jgi:hypothetical protein
MRLLAFPEPVENVQLKADSIRRTCDFSVPQRLLDFGGRLNTSGSTTLGRLYDDHALVALYTIKEAVQEEPDPITRGKLLLAFSAILKNCSKMYRFHEGGGGSPIGAYYVPSIRKELNPLFALKEKLGAVVSTLHEISEWGPHSFVVSNQSAARLDIPSNSIDYVFTDPPYSDTMPFGDLNFLWDGWLYPESLCRTGEAIGDSWYSVMLSVFREVYRVLKPGACCSVCYHDTSEGTWGDLLDLMAEAGFKAIIGKDVLYHRTDSQNFSAEALAEIRAFAQANLLPIPAKPRTWKSKESAQEAHEAIRPTHLQDRNAGEDDDQRKLYILIWQRAVASQLADAEYSVNTITMEAQQGAQTFVFKATGLTLTAPGWRVLTAQDAAEEAEDNAEGQDDNNGAVPAVRTGTALQSTSTRLLNKQTKPPNGYTQASLIKKLESERIGRPSTYPSILKNIITRNYLIEGKKILTASDLAKLLIDSLTGKFRFVEYDYTRALEQELDDIASGKAQYLSVVSALDGLLNIELGQLHIERQPVLAAHRPAGGATSATEAGIPCPKCKIGHLRRPNGKDFYGCDQYRQGCSFSVNVVIAKKKLTDKQIETLSTKGKTALIKGFTSKQGKPFDAFLVCSEATEWRTKFQFESK